jgi:hypothetical protein
MLLCGFERNAPIARSRRAYDGLHAEGGEPWRQRPRETEAVAACYELLTHSVTASLARRLDLRAD